MKDERLTIKEAYLAMFEYLDNLYNLTGSEDLGGFLGGMDLLNDGKPIDPAAWSDWLEAVNKVKRNFD